MKNLQRPSTLPFVVAGALGLPLFLAACAEHTANNPMEKARLIKEKRTEANDWLARYEASECQDLDALKRYVELHRETTEIAPSTCPRCWGEYGEALSMMGYHYWYLWDDVKKEMETARGTPEAAQLKAEAEEYKKEWVKYFTESNRAYDQHFRSQYVTAIHPYSYERVMRHNEFLGNFDQALYYLQRYVDAYPMIGTMDETARQRVEKLRRIYRTEAQRQKDKGAMEEISGKKAAKEPPAQPASGTAARPKVIGGKREKIEEE